MPTNVSKLRIAVLGAGRIGSAFAFQLARDGGHDVTVIARPGSPRLRQLERDGAIVNVKGERAPVQVTDRLDEQSPFDVLIVTLLAHQTEPLLPILQRNAAECVQFMFNTFDPQTLLSAVGVERCAFGMPFIQATLDADGRLAATIGAGGQKTLIGRQSLVDLFNAAGLPAALEPDMPLWLRCHAPVCIALESVSVAAMRRGGGASWGETRVLARGMQASFALIKGLGFQIYPRTKQRIAASPALLIASVLWLMSRIASFRELLSTGEAECAALIEALVAAGAAAKPAMATSDIRAMKPEAK